MNCDTYLQMLETLPVDELAYGDAAHHVATCRDCDRVTRVVAERERNMLLAYGTITPPVATAPLTAHAIELSRRRRVAFFYRVGLAVAAVVAVVGFIMTRRVAPALGRVTETYVIRCVPAEEVASLVGPYLPPTVSIVARGNVLRIGGPSRAELEPARSLLDSYERQLAPQCAVPAAAPVRALGPAAVVPRLQR